MTDRMKRNAALYMLITIVDQTDGNVIVGNGEVRRVFNDDNDIVTIEYLDGSTDLAANAEYDVLNSIILHLRTQDNERKQVQNT